MRCELPQPPGLHSERAALAALHPEMPCSGFSGHESKWGLILYKSQMGSVSLLRSGTHTLASLPTQPEFCFEEVNSQFWVSLLL